MALTKARHLLIAGVLPAIVVYLLIRVTYNDVPPIPLFAGASLLLVAVVDAILAWTLGPRVKRREGYEPVEPLSAARAVALAKASSMAGAIVGGIWLGLLGYVFPRGMVVPDASADTGSAVIGLISALALVAAGLYLERNLRNPDEPDEPLEGRE